jgi:hypothetical protein
MLTVSSSCFCLRCCVATDEISYDVGHGLLALGARYCKEVHEDYRWYLEQCWVSRCLRSLLQYELMDDELVGLAIEPMLLGEGYCCWDVAAVAGMTWPQD